ncbi:MAG: nucleotidyltransferase domain-containing protein, partial [Rikenellaceae bacterium]
MKKSIKSLPKCTQNELAVLQELILKHLSKVAMVILFGSYAKKKYVIWDEYMEDGIRYSYQSDLDILMVV